jgi:hypothetical protein
MKIACYATERAHCWPTLLRSAGHAVTALVPYERAETADLAVVVLSNPLAARNWLRELEPPLVLITRSLVRGQRLCSQLPRLRLLCHPQRAALTLPQLLVQIGELHAGTLVLGPPLVVPIERGEARR